ncbi:MAG TPA: citryl-CoA lyase [Chloroflexota bacterium]|nr:citryl-CoA lyase [Chloroflexota bacterium]
MERLPIRTRLARVEHDRVLIRGLDLCEELLGNITFADMAGLTLIGRLPTPAERRMLDAVLVVLVEHGMVSSVISARLTYATAPESIQAAVAASLLGAGSVHLGSSDICARILSEGLAAEPDSKVAAEAIVRRFAAAHERIPGLGHRTHPAGDPRAVRLFAIARETEVYGKYSELLELMVEATERHMSRRLPVNVTGAIAAISLDLGLPWQIAKAFALIGRTLGTMAHIREEIEMPAAPAIDAAIKSALQTD